MVESRRRVEGVQLVLNQESPIVRKAPGTPKHPDRPRHPLRSRVVVEHDGEECLDVAQRWTKTFVVMPEVRLQVGAVWLRTAYVRRDRAARPRRGMVAEAALGAHIGAPPDAPTRTVEPFGAPDRPDGCLFAEPRSLAFLAVGAAARPGDRLASEDSHCATAGRPRPGSA